MKFWKKFVALALVLATILSVVVTAQAAFSTMYVNCPEGETVRLRKTASSSGTILLNIPRGTAVQAEAYDSTWHKVIYGDTTGYMMSSFLSTNPPDSNDNYITMYVTCTPGETVNLRKSATTSASIVVRIPNGTAVQAKYYNSSWYQVKYGSYSGYMMATYLTTTDPNADVTGYEKYLSKDLLKLTSKGQAVTNLQLMLNAKGYSCGTADGIFGTNTETAVKNFQRAKGLSVDGIVGNDTKAALWAACDYKPVDGCDEVK